MIRRALPLALMGILAACSGQNPSDDDDATTSPGGATPTPTAAPTQAPTQPPTQAPTATQAPTPTLAPTPTEPPAQTVFDLAVQLTDMTGAGLQNNCYVRVLTQGGAEVARASQTPMQNPSFTLQMPDSVTTGQVYNIDIWVDFTGDGLYQPPPTKPSENATSDRSWRISSGLIVADTQVNFAFNTSYTDVAWPQ